MTEQSLQESGALALIGERISRRRLENNLTQAELATNAGVSKRTVERLEAGESTQLSNFLRILRALDLLDGLEALLPAVPPSPIDQLKLKGRQRQRASSSREPEAQPRAWTWKDAS
ncbi:helix-turn-helix transcriptional regulator [Dokdonella sp.]|uniref:helix-turn-helix transcriptional regulator n=1 Tax=Dokdonella sp. TaxID=2291710 RepID=UPI00352846AD